VHQRDTFDTVADLYGDARPGYPATLYDDLVDLAGLGPDAIVLEVGCGAGQATKDLAPRSRRVVALDPGENLVAEAARRTRAPNVEYVVSGFEAYRVERGAFDLVVSAQAWHWVDAEVGFAKAADALRERGALAVWGHVPLSPPEPFAAAFKAIYDRHLPGAWGTPPGSAWYLPNGPVSQLFAASARFGPSAHRAYDWSWTFDADTFGRYLRTDSSYHAMGDARFALFDELSAAIAAAGAPLVYPWQTHLHVARKL
jgi:SAM-dependent methyltransferase